MVTSTVYTCRPLSSFICWSRFIWNTLNTYSVIVFNNINTNVRKAYFKINDHVIWNFVMILSFWVCSIVQCDVLDDIYEVSEENSVTFVLFQIDPEEGLTTSRSLPRLLQVNNYSIFIHYIFSHRFLFFNLIS